MNLRTDVKNIYINVLGYKILKVINNNTVAVRLTQSGVIHYTVLCNVAVCQDARFHFCIIKNKECAFFFENLISHVFWGFFKNNSG